MKLGTVVSAALGSPLALAKDDELVQNPLAEMYWLRDSDSRELAEHDLLQDEAGVCERRLLGS